MTLNRLCMLPLAGLLTGFISPSGVAQDANGFPRRLVTTVVQDAGEASRQGNAVAVQLNDAGMNDLPASITQPSGVLSLAPAGIQALPAVPTTGHGCNVCPDVRCKGPLYSGCSPRIYYGTNPRDDDPILPLYPRINDPNTNHWYSAALKMVLRKKGVTETMK